MGVTCGVHDLLIGTDLMSNGLKADAERFLFTPLVQYTREVASQSWG